MRGGLPLPITGTVSPFVLLYKQRDVMSATGTLKSSAGYIHVEPRLFLQIWPFRIPI